MEEELLEYLGYGDRSSYGKDDYDNIANKYNVLTLEHEHEKKLYTENGSVYFIKNFPEHTSPFWNMKRDPDSVYAKKIDVILSGHETIGSAERETDPNIMRERFNRISEGQYAKAIFSKFGKERSLKELDEFMNLNFFPRSGGGIGITRLIRSMKMENIM